MCRVYIVWKLGHWIVPLYSKLTDKKRVQCEWIGSTKAVSIVVTCSWEADGEDGPDFRTWYSTCLAMGTLQMVFAAWFGNYNIPN